MYPSENTEPPERYHMHGTHGWLALEVYRMLHEELM
jgi:hypothetical protein